MKTMSVRMSDDLHELIVEAAEADGRSRHSWIVRALERAVTQTEPKVRRGPALLSDTAEGRAELQAIIHDAQGVDPELLRQAADAARDRIKPVPAPKRSFFVKTQSSSGGLWCRVEDTEITFEARPNQVLRLATERIQSTLGLRLGEFEVTVR